MKKLIGIVSIAALFAGCGKSNEYPNDFSSVMFLNGASGITTFNVLVDNVAQTGSPIAFRGASAYLNVRPGVRDIAVRTNNIAITSNYATLPAQDFPNQTASTYVVYDTLASVTGSLRTVRLRDTLTAPPAGFMKFRFLPLANFAPAVDVTFLRTTATPNDSITLFNRQFIGNSPSASTLADIERFVQVPAGGYTVKVKLAGTQTAYLAPTSLTTATTIGGITKGIYTLFATGTAASQAYGLSIARNYP